MSKPFPKRMLVAAAAMLACPGLVYGFGTVNFLGQHAEHEKITRTALGCHANNAAFVREGLCFQARSLDEIAGKNGTFGAIGAHDNPANGEGEKSEAHCDNSKLLECRDYIDAEINLAVAAARPLLHWNSGDRSRDGGLDDSQIPTIVSCTYLRQKGRAKCNVLEHLGSALQAAQDFYSHSNWADETGPGPITLTNPFGLNRADIAPLLNVRHPAGPVPGGLISGCFISEGPADARGSKRRIATSHEVLNKDKGVIDPLRFGRPGDPTLTTAATPHGKIGRNFH